MTLNVSPELAAYDTTNGSLPPMSVDENARAAAETGTPLDDSPLAQWTADRLKGSCRWTGGLGWMAYMNGVWKEATEAAVIEKFRKQFTRLYQTEIAQGAGYERAKRLATLRSAGKIRAVTGLLKGILEVDAESFDNHPDLLNAANGVIDLRTGAMLEHSPTYLFTKITKIKYTPGARHPDWNRALQAMPVEVQPFMQVRFGQAATGHPVPDDIMPVLQGGGENGKSTVIAAIHAALGDHAVYIPERLLLSNPGDHPTELTTLQGARFAIIEETPEARHLNIKRLKDTVGTPTMTARRIRQDSITWKTSHSLFLTSNYRPKINETDDGTWRRLALVRFPYTFVKPGQPLTEPHHRHGDQGLRDRLPASKEAMQAVLAWLVEGAMAWYANAKTMPPLPDRVRADTEEWRGESDSLGSYLAEHIEFDPDSAILSSELLTGLNEWLKGQGQLPWGAVLLSARLESNADMKRHPTKKRRLNNPTNLSRLMPMDSPVKSGKETVWEGIRFSR